jgi:hypothetical protein
MNGVQLKRAVAQIVLILSVAVVVVNVAITSARRVEATYPSNTVWHLRDQDVGIQMIGNYDNVGKSVFCVTSDDCKIVYYDHTNGDLKFFDCDDAQCLTGTATTVDSLNNVGDQLSLYCPAANDCKIAYIDETNTALMFYDCDNATCSAGTRTVVDGDTGCALAGGNGCLATRYAGTYPSI